MFLKKLVTLLFLITFANFVHAKELPVFKVEVLVFESLALKGWTEERWKESSEMINTNRAVRRKPLKYSQNMLNQQAQKMTGKKGYHKLFHQSWLVKAKTKRNSRPILIRASKGSDLEGSIVFYKSRYPHIKLNLELNRRIPNRIKEAFAAQQNIAIEDLPNDWLFTISESRKIKSNQLHYIDHPLFGALVQIQWQQKN